MMGGVPHYNIIKEAMRYVLNSTPYDQKGLTSERLEPEPKIYMIEN